MNIEKLEKIIEEVLDVESCFTRHKYWTEKIYYTNKKLFTKYKDKDEMDLKNSIIIKSLYGNGIYGIPCGCSWFHFCKKEDCEKFLLSYQDLFEDYVQWQLKQL